MGSNKPTPKGLDPKQNCWVSLLNVSTSPPRLEKMDSHYRVVQLEGLKETISVHNNSKPTEIPQVGFESYRYLVKVE